MEWAYVAWRAGCLGGKADFVARQRNIAMSDMVIYWNGAEGEDDGNMPMG